jgi:hypothetical protein
MGSALIVIWYGLSTGEDWGSLGNVLGKTWEVLGMVWGMIWGTLGDGLVDGLGKTWE